MAETQNVFVTKTRNNFLPAIQAFTDYLSKYTQQQMELTEKTLQIKRRQQMETYGSDLQKRFAGAKSLEEVNALTGQVLGETIEQGYNELIPMIGQYSSIYSRGMQMEQQQRGAKASLGMLDNDQQVFFGGKLRKMGDLKAELAPMFGEGNEAMLAEVLGKLDIAKTSELITRQADTGKIIYSSGTVTPTGEWLNVENKDVQRQGGVPYIERNNQPGMQDEEKLNPLLQQQYSTALYQAEQDAKSKRMEAMQWQQLQLKQDDISLANLNQTSTAVWRSKSGFYEKAFEEELNKAREDDKAEIDDIKFLPKGERYIQIRSKYFTGPNQDQLQPNREKDIEKQFATDPEFQLMKSLEETATEMKYAFSKNVGTKEYQKMERAYTDDPIHQTEEHENRWIKYTPEERVNAVLNWAKTKGKQYVRQ